MLQDPPRPHLMLLVGLASYAYNDVWKSTWLLGGTQWGFGILIYGWKCYQKRLQWFGFCWYLSHAGVTKRQWRIHIYFFASLCKCRTCTAWTRSVYNFKRQPCTMLCYSHHWSQNVRRCQEIALVSSSFCCFCWLGAQSSELRSFLCRKCMIHLTIIQPSSLEYFE